MKQARNAEQRVAMSYEFEDLLNQLRSKKEKSHQQTESQRMEKLNKILSQSVKTFELNINGNQTTKYDFIKEELNVSTPNTIENCSIQIYDGINRLKDELDLISTANAIIDIDKENPSSLICDLRVKEKSRLTATIGATHDMDAMSQLNGSLSVGIRNLFGNGEKLDLSADIGLATTNININEFNSFNSFNSSLIHNTSNQYNITFNKPRIHIINNIINKSNLILRGFQHKLDRTRSSSYREDSLGTTSSLISYNQQHCLSYNFHLRSLIPTNNNTNDNNNTLSSPSISDESTMMSTKSSFQYKFIKDTRNHASIPSTGYLIKTETEFAGIGGDVDFIKTLLSFYYHTPFNYKSVLNIALQTGFVMPWKKYLPNININSDGDEYVRIIDRIIPFGGLQLRGFEHAQIGPKDRNDYVHCDFLFSGGISMAIPIFEWLYGNIFFNFSYCNLLRNMSLNSINSINQLIHNSNASSGISFIIPFPVGRLEIGYSYPIKTNNNPFSPWFWAFDVQFF